MDKRTQKAIIRGLSDSMKRHFLDKAKNLPPEWDGIEIRTWMAEEWQRESYSRHLKGNTKRGRAFRSAKYNRGI